MTPRTLSNDGMTGDRRSPLSSTSASSSAQGVKTDADAGPPTSSSDRASKLPTHSPRGKIAIRIGEGRNLKPASDPYVVCQFEWNEYVSGGSRHDAMEIDHRGGDRTHVRRDDGDSGRPMAIPMRSRQTSSNGLTEAEARQSMKVTDPQWDHEATL